MIALQIHAFPIMVFIPAPGIIKRAPNLTPPSLTDASNALFVCLQDFIRAITLHFSTVYLLLWAEEAVWRDLLLANDWDCHFYIH